MSKHGSQNSYKTVIRTWDSYEREVIRTQSRIKCKEDEKSSRGPRMDLNSTTREKRAEDHCNVINNRRHHVYETNHETV